MTNGSVSQKTWAIQQKLFYSLEICHSGIITESSWLILNAWVWILKIFYLFFTATAGRKKCRSFRRTRCQVTHFWWRWSIRGDGHSRITTIAIKYLNSSVKFLQRAPSQPCTLCSTIFISWVKAMKFSEWNGHILRVGDDSHNYYDSVMALIYAQFIIHSYML